MNKQTKINENAQETKNREEFIMLSNSCILL
jgi:hypothetical protein